MRLTWRLRPSWMVSSSVSGPTAAHAGRRGHPVLELHARAQRPERAVRTGPPPSDGAVGLWHLEARVREAVGELAVVGQQDQAGRVDVQPSDRDTAAAGWARARPPCAGPGVAGGRDHAGRLVDGVDDCRRSPRHARAVEATVVRRVRRRGPDRSPSRRRRSRVRRGSAPRRPAARRRPARARYLASRTACHHSQRGPELLDRTLDELGQPAYRERQVWRWAAQGAACLRHMTDLPLTCARRCRGAVPFSTLALEHEAHASRRDGQGAVLAPPTAGRSRPC